MAKILALDIGTKRVGVAVSDADQTMAFPRETFAFGNKSAFLKRVKALVDEEKIGMIVLGLPLDENNEATEWSEKIQTLGMKLSGITELPVHFVDEFLTSREARAKIPLRRDRRKKGSDDSLAAQIILERYLKIG
nr:Holliday junction resolvase RuvX [Candidatus Peregrinibacteria bacterium]